MNGFFFSPGVNSGSDEPVGSSLRTIGLTPQAQCESLKGLNEAQCADPMENVLF